MDVITRHSNIQPVPQWILYLWLSKRVQEETTIAVTFPLRIVYSNWNIVTHNHYYIESRGNKYSCLKINLNIRNRYKKKKNRKANTWYISKIFTVLKPVSDYIRSVTNCRVVSTIRRIVFSFRIRWWLSELHHRNLFLSLLACQENQHY